MANRTFLALQDQCLTELEEDTTSPVFHTRDIVKSALNDAYRLLGVVTEFNRENLTINTTASTLDYNLLDEDEDIICIHRVQNDDTEFWLKNSTVPEMDAHRSNWVGVEGAPETMIPRSPFQLSLFPVPSTTSTLSAQVSTVPVQLSADGDQTAVMIEEFDRALIEGAKSFLYAQEREWEKAEAAHQEFLSLARQLKTWVDRRGTARRDVFGAN
jgi:hypothetical protein